MPLLSASELAQFGATLSWVADDGTSQLVLGDVFEVSTLLDDESVDCVWTDPPYLLSNDGITCINGRMVKVNKGEWDRSRGVDLDHQFNLGWIAACFRVLRPGGTIWVSGTLHCYPSVGLALQQVGFTLLNDIVWEKPAPPPNLSRRRFTHSTEILLWAAKPAAKRRLGHTFNYGEMRAENGGKQMKNVWKMSPPSRAEKLLGKHPTQKPVALVERCLRASTSPGELVFDPFAGSGTTGIAALRTGRRFLGCEMDAGYADLASRRLAEMQLVLT